MKDGDSRFYKQIVLISGIVFIILLILVGFVYINFQDIANHNTDPEKLNHEQKVVASDYSIMGVEKVGNGTNGVRVFVRNTGDQDLNFTKYAVLRVGLSGNIPKSVENLTGKSCKWFLTEKNSSNGILEPGNDAFCDTGLSWPSEYDDNRNETFELSIDGTLKESYTCDAGEESC